MLRIDHILVQGEQVVKITSSKSDRVLVVHFLETGIVVEHNIPELETLMYSLGSVYEAMIDIEHLLEHRK